MISQRIALHEQKFIVLYPQGSRVQDTGLLSIVRQSPQRWLWYLLFWPLFCMVVSRGVTFKNNHHDDIECDNQYLDPIPR